MDLLRTKGNFMDSYAPLSSYAPQSSRSRPRVSAAILRQNGDEDEVLMVQHCRRDGTLYWQLPGGGLENGETEEQGILRELFEETALQGRIIRWLFSIPYRYGSSTTFLVEIEAGAEAILGSDPEEEDLDHQKLVGVAWKSLSEMQESPEVRVVTFVLSYLHNLS